MYFVRTQGYRLEEIVNKQGPVIVTEWQKPGDIEELSPKYIVSKDETENNFYWEVVDAIKSGMLDLKVGDVIRINGNEEHSSVHIVTQTYHSPHGDGRVFGVDGYTLLCKTPYYDDDMKAGEITPLYLKNS